MSTRNSRRFGSRIRAALAAALLAMLGCVGIGALPASAAAVGIDLYAVSGTTSVPGAASLTVWGYNSTGAAANGPGGPTLTVNQGDVVTVTLHNQLAVPTGLRFQGQAMIPDTVGTAAGTTKAYTFTAGQAGTYLYGAALLPGAQYQSAMGLYGALIVRPDPSFGQLSGSNTAEDPTGATLTDAAAAFTHDLVGGIVTNTTDASSCTVTATTATTLTCATALAGGTANTWAVGDGYTTRPNSAYASSASLFNDEGVLVLAEIDPTLNGSTNPAAFDMRNYRPKYYLINGQVSPNTTHVMSAAGNRALLRYLNAGIHYHSMAVLGAHQTVIALDGSPLNYGRRYVAETFGPGQTADAIVDIPAGTTDGSKLAIYDGSLLLRNNNTAGSGGMLTFIDVTGGPSSGDTTGPVTSNVAYDSGTLTVSAHVDDTANGGSNIAAAEYYLDSTTVAATNMNATDGAFDSPTEDVTLTLATAVPSGQHILYVRGQDAAGNWGLFSAKLLDAGDGTGPATTGLVLTPNQTNGSTPVAVSATGNDSATGGSNIVAAEYFIDTDPGVGNGQPMTVNLPAPIASLNATIPASVLSTLSGGVHTVSARSRDAAGNWGPASASVDLTVAGVLPVTSGVTATPNPSNGKVGYNPSIAAVRVNANFTEPGTGSRPNIVAAEGFIDTVGGNGSGFVFAANDGAFNSPSEAGHADIPLATISQLANGNHTIYVHAKDAVGSWGATSTTVLVVDKTAPVVTGVSAAPNPTLGATSVTLSATATDVGTGVTAAEWYTGTDPGQGNATAMTLTGTGPWNLSATINVGSWAVGDYVVNVRAKDAAGNWSSLGSTTLVVFPGLYFSTAGNTNPPTVTGTADDADIYYWTGAAYSRSIDVTAITNPLPNNANVDGYDRVDATHFYLSFAGTVNVPGLGNVPDEDVVYYNAGTWSLFYDGSVNGVTANLDAISIVGGQLYFSLSTNAVPPGAGGPGDDADIYRWNSGSSYTRVVDASGAGSLGLPAAANVDGFVRVDATHFYLSFSADTTAPGLGAVQDEDVVYYNSGSWSVFFDGTAHGLTSGNLDVDAFDLP